MNRFIAAAVAATSLCTGFNGDASAAPQPLDAFARLPYMRDVTLSPDSRRVAFVSSVGEESVVVTFERASPATTARTLFRSEANKYDVSWCSWANQQRLLCGLSGVIAEGGRLFQFTRLMAINADGSNMKMLSQRWKGETAQYHDRVIDWTPGNPDTVLLELDDDHDGFPSVFELNINTGTQTTHTHERLPIRSFISDGQGNVRLGSGYADDDSETQYFARLADERDWRRLSSIRTS
ncbi:MAG TPA: hypothetical protein VIT67_14985, partial [Povalibacter sp.]